MAYFFNPKYINEQVLSLMETKGLKWKKPWIEKVGGGLPMNAVTGKPYHGMNVLLLMGSWNSGGTYWATLKQWGSIGVRVREDQIKKGTAICFSASKRLVMEGDDGQEKTSYQPVIKTFLVYSSRQIEGGWEEPVQPKKLYETQGSALVQGAASPSNTVRHAIEVFRSSQPPMIAELSAPDTVLLPGPGQVSLLLITLRASDQDGPGDIREGFFRNLDSPTDTTRKIFLLDDGHRTGVSGDSTANDGTFSITVQLPYGTPAATYRFRFEATDRSGIASNTILHPLTVLNPE